MTVHLLTLILQAVKVFFWEIWAFLYRSVTSGTWLQADFMWKPNAGSLSMKELCLHIPSLLQLLVFMTAVTHAEVKLKGQAGRWAQHWTMCPFALCPLWDPPWNSRKSRKTPLGQSTKQFGTGMCQIPGVLGSIWRRLCWELWGAQYLAALSPGDKDSCLFPEMLALCWTRCGNGTLCRDPSCVPWGAGWEHCSFFTCVSELHCLMASFT